MTHSDKILRREEAAEYWSGHEATDLNSQEVTESIRVRKPLSAMISVRLSDEDLSRLKNFARTHDVGVTTMARMLLHQGLEDPVGQLMFQALRSEVIQSEIAEIVEDAKVPPGEGEPEFLVLSKAHLEQMYDMVSKAALRLMTDGLEAQSITVTRSQGEIYNKLSELSTVSA